MTLILCWDIYVNFRDPFWEDGRTLHKVISKTFCLHSAVKKYSYLRKLDFINNAKLKVSFVKSILDHC